MGNKKVKTLDFSFNNLSAKGFKKILNKLKHHPSLQNIILQGNQLDDKIFALIERFGKGGNLKVINVKNNPITKDFKQ